jgi:hypothetical protein
MVAAMIRRIAIVVLVVVIVFAIRWMLSRRKDNTRP